MVDYRAIKREIKGIGDEKKMREYVLEHDDILINIPTALLNSWLQIEGLKFYRHRGLVGITAKEAISRTITNTKADISSIKADITTLIARMDNIEATHAAHDNRLKLVEAALTDHAKVIGEHDTTITDNTSAIAQLTVEFNEIRSAIRDIVAAITELEK
ncbi:MAG: hypothetical protein LBN20_04530 [Endomicrobium sp.]|nr:hypothetical protein [Endomicrobium sp.]